MKLVCAGFCICLIDFVAVFLRGFDEGNLGSLFLGFERFD